MAVSEWMIPVRCKLGGIWAKIVFTNSAQPVLTTFFAV